MIDDYHVIASDGERWTRATFNGAKGLADNLTRHGRGAIVYSSAIDEFAHEHACSAHYHGHAACDCARRDCVMYVGVNREEDRR